GRHPGHGAHGPQLVAPVRRDHGRGDGGRGPDDPRRSDRTGVRLASRRGGGTCHPADPGSAADPRQWNGRVRGDPDRSGGREAAAVSLRGAAVNLAYERVAAHLDRLKLKRVAELLDPICEQATKDSLSYLDFLERLWRPKPQAPRSVACWPRPSGLESSPCPR